MNDRMTETIKESPFYNGYGGLDLVKDDEGNLWLRMSDSIMGDDFFGPLSLEQVAAFELLCQAPEV